MTIFNVTYKDDKGEEITFFESDGSTLNIKLRGINFTGKSFDYLEPSEDFQKANELFKLNQDNEITNCEMLVKIPVKLNDRENLIESILIVEILINETNYPKTKKFSICVDNKSFDIITNDDTGLYFESQLISLQKKIPINYKIYSCLFCALSHYSVYGSDKFGTLICYKELKDKILKIDNKSDFVKLTDNKGNSVQETFYCPEFMEITSELWLYKDTV